jgi:hypothetical protein
MVDSFSSAPQPPEATVEEGARRKQLATKNYPISILLAQPSNGIHFSGNEVFPKIAKPCHFPVFSL